MKKYLILHGRGGDENQNWFPWLKKELMSFGIEVTVPNLPNSINPLYEEQIEYIKKYKDFLEEGDVIVGHSLGCKLAIHFIEKHKLKGLKVLLVAPAYPGIVEEKGKFFFGNAYENISQYSNKELKFEKLGNEYKIFLSNDDPYINMQKAKDYFKNLENVEFIDFKAMGHFNQGACVYGFKELLEY